MNDSELKAAIRECLDGKSEPFNLIVKTFQKSLYHFTYQYTRNPEEAGDATVEIFFKAYRALDSFKPGYKFSNWLYKIAFNHLVEKSRRKKIEQKYLNSEVAYHSDIVQSETPDSVFFRNESKEKVQNSLYSIPFKNRIALMLRYYHQLSYKQIGLIMGIPRNTVASLILRGKSELRSMLGKEEI